ncbi:hypothetical protein HDE_00863 [Halotydeus destructor]|nr:hypothetical protein HDE_00863 [Halotydeus destructor]
MPRTTTVRPLSPSSLSPIFGGIIFRDVPSIALVKLRVFDDRYRAMAENALEGRFEQNFIMAKPDSFYTAAKALEAIIDFVFLHHSHYIELPYWFDEVFEAETGLKLKFLDTFRSLKKLPYPLRLDWKTLSHYARVSSNLQELKIRGSSPCPTSEVEYFLNSLDHAHGVSALDLANPSLENDGSLIVDKLVHKRNAGFFSNLKELFIIPHRFKPIKLQELAQVLPERCQVVIKFRGTTKLHDSLLDVEAEVQKTLNFVQVLGCKLKSIDASLNDYMYEDAVKMMPHVQKLKLMDTGETELTPPNLSSAVSLTHLFYINQTANGTAVFKNLCEINLTRLSKLRLHLTPALFLKIEDFLARNGQNVKSLDFNSRLFPNDEFRLSNDDVGSSELLSKCDFGGYLPKNMRYMSTDQSVLASIRRWVPRVNCLSLTLTVPTISFCALVRLLLSQERRSCRLEMFDYRPETADDIFIPLELLGFVCGLVKHSEYLSISFSTSDKRMACEPSRWLSQHSGYAEFIITTETSQWIEQQYNGTHEIRRRTKPRRQFLLPDREKRKYVKLRRCILELQYRAASCVARLSRWVLLRNQELAYISPDVTKLSEEEWNNLDSRLESLENEENSMNQRLAVVFASAL